MLGETFPSTTLPLAPSSLPLRDFEGRTIQPSHSLSYNHDAVGNHLLPLPADRHELTSCDYPLRTLLQATPNNFDKRQGSGFENPAEPSRPRKRKARNLRARDWEPYKERILDLYIKEGLSLDQVKQIIASEYGFTAETRQYRLRVAQWGKDKNIKTQEMAAIVRKRQKRSLVETDKRELVFEVRGTPVEAHKIERWMKRHSIPDSLLFSTSSTASTPSAVGYHTVSERTFSERGSVASEASREGTYNAAQSSEMQHPTKSNPDVVHLQENVFEGQSPTIEDHSIQPRLSSGPSTSETQASSPLSRYREDEEMYLRNQILSADISIPSSGSNASAVLYKLGRVLIEQGRFKVAEDVARKLVESLEHQICDGDAMVTCSGFDLLARVFHCQGLHRRAEKLQRQALEGREKELGPSHPLTLSSVDNLGSVLLSLRNFEEAEALHQQGLEEGKRALGPDHPVTLSSVDNLGLVLSSLGLGFEAEKLHLEALEQRRKVLGPDHPDTLSSVDHLGAVLWRLGQHQEAKGLHQQALAGRQRVLGIEHPDTLASANNLGLVLLSLKKYKEAEVLLRQALEGRQKVLGPDHPDTLASIRCQITNQGSPVNEHSSCHATPQA